MELKDFHKSLEASVQLVSAYLPMHGPNVIDRIRRPRTIQCQVTTLGALILLQIISMEGKNSISGHLERLSLFCCLPIILGAGIGIVVLSGPVSRRLGHSSLGKFQGFLLSKNDRPDYIVP